MAADRADVSSSAPGRITDYLALRWVDNATAWRWLAVISVYLVAALATQAILRGAFGIMLPPNPLDGVEVGPLFLLRLSWPAPCSRSCCFAAS